MAGTLVEAVEPINRPASDSPARVLDICVVIVTYRSAQVTIQALESLARERAAFGLPLRAVVVDNDSGDLTAIGPVVESSGWSSWITLVASPRNGGFAYANNLGIERACAVATPSYFYLLNPDTQIRPGAIQALTGFLETHPHAGIAGSSFETPEGKEWPIAFRFPTLWGELLQGLDVGFITRWFERWSVVRRMSGSTEQVDWISGAAIMVRSDVFRRIGGLDEHYFLFYEETDFCRRARLAGFTTWYVPESRVMHIGGYSTSLSERERKRLPAYWFESRRRYYCLAFGVRRAMAIDVVAVVAHSLGYVKRTLQGRRLAGVPHFIRDLIQHSVLWKRNRAIPPPRCALRCSSV